MIRRTVTKTIIVGRQILSQSASILGDSRARCVYVTVSTCTTIQTRMRVEVIVRDIESISGSIARQLGFGKRSKRLGEREAKWYSAEEKFEQRPLILAQWTEKSRSTIS